MKNVLKLILTFIVLESGFKQTLQQQQQPQPQLQAQTSGGLNQNIYQFIKSTQTLSRVCIIKIILLNHLDQCILFYFSFL